MLTRVPFSQVTITDSFWSPRIATNCEVTTWACIKKCVETGRVENFMNAGKSIKGEPHGEFQGLLYNDSDVYKVIEGIAYVLGNQANAQLEAAADEIITAIASAQHPDGYINTYFTLVLPDKRWTDMMYHEMYCIGHMIEAAIAYRETTDKELLFHVAVKAADHLYEHFLAADVHWIPGHQEIELALIKLYHATGDKRYLDLSHYLVEQRGKGVPFLDVLKPCREEMGGAKYNQDDKPADELSEISGHAVRAMYYYSAITDLAALEHNTGYEAAMDRVYASMQRNMYLTGGIGQSRSNEGFTQDYDLPNDSYCETCASVGVVYWASRMNRLKMRANYMDVAERAMYNGAIAGISLSGDRFFYVNPLVSDGTHHRKPWHNTSCCPTQITRFLPSVGDYLYAIKGSTIFVNLYVQSKAKIVLSEETVTLSQTTNYPWDGNITIRLEENLKTPVVLKLRIPDWCRGFVLSQNGKSLASSCVTDGYVTVSGCCKAGDTVRLELEMPIRLVTADERVVQDRSKVAVARGPLVYCMEGTDNADMADYAITDGSRFVTQHSEELGGAVTILDAVGGGVFVPYYAWDNRDAGTMQVWVTYRQDNTDWVYSM